jgi:hypothetical protein
MCNKIREANCEIITLKDIFRLQLWLCIVMFLLSSCNLLTTNGNEGYTGSIRQSKKLGVFISEYRPLTNRYNINDSLSINIKSAWIERSWTYEGIFSEKAAVDSDYFHLIIKTDINGLKDCLQKWVIRVNDGKYFACASGDGLIGTFHILPKDSIIKCKVENRPGVENSSSAKVIGYILLKRTGNYQGRSTSKDEDRLNRLMQSNKDTTKGKK